MSDGDKNESISLVTHDHTTGDENDDIPVVTPDHTTGDENDDIPVVTPDDITKQDEQSIQDAPSYEALQKLLEEQIQKTLAYEDKLKHALADFQNMSRKTQTDIENGVNAKVDELFIEFLKVYDDLERAKLALPSRDVDAGLDSILKNMDSLLTKYDVKPIDALGEIFDPNVHEAISVINDPNLDDDTITKEIRKGYISRNKVIRPTLVEISKKVSQNE